MSTDLLEIVRGCIVPEPFVSHSGLELPWKWEWERAGPRNLKLFAEALCTRYPVAGIDRGGWALVVNLPGNGSRVLVQRDVVNTGGEPIDAPVTLIDDVVTTGRSFRAAEIALELHGIAVRERVCVLDRRKECGVSTQQNIRSLFTTEDVANVRVSSGA